MGWALHYIEKLKNGETVSFRPRGNSMTGRIESGQLCTVDPVTPSTLEVGDIVLCKVNGSEYLHIVKAIQGERFQIGNNRGRINGWFGPNAIYGKCVRIEP
jgi:Peptidase S24-like